MITILFCTDRYRSLLNILSFNSVNSYFNRCLIAPIDFFLSELIEIGDKSDKPRKDTFYKNNFISSSLPSLTMSARASALHNQTLRFVLFLFIAYCTSCTNKILMHGWILEGGPESVTPFDD